MEIPLCMLRYLACVALASFSRQAHVHVVPLTTSCTTPLLLALHSWIWNPHCHTGCNEHENPMPPSMHKIMNDVVFGDVWFD